MDSPEFRNKIRRCKARYLHYIYAYTKKSRGLLLWGHVTNYSPPTCDNDCEVPSNRTLLNVHTALFVLFVQHCLWDTIVLSYSNSDSYISCWSYVHLYYCVFLLNMCAVFVNATMVFVAVGGHLVWRTVIVGDWNRNSIENISFYNTLVCPKLCCGWILLYPRFEDSSFMELEIVPMKSKPFHSPMIPCI